MLKRLATLALLCVLSPAGWTQPPQAGPLGPGNVYAFGSVIHTVADLDRSVAFYERALGLKLTSEDEVPVANAAIQQLVGAPGARFRHAMLAIPGTFFPLELVQFTGVSRHPAGLSGMQDPGNLMVSFRVRDLDAVVAAARDAGATVLTPGGVPLRRNNARTGAANRAIFLRDPDGFLFELTQFYGPAPGNGAPGPQVPAAAAAGGSGEVLGANAGQSVADPQRTAAFWRAIGGVGVTVGTRFNSDRTEMQLGATEHGALRGSSAVIGGSNERWTLFQFRGLPRHRFAPRPIDPGAPAFSLRVHDIAAAIAAVRAHGGARVTQAGPVSMQGPAGTTLHSFIRDPDGFLFELVQ